MDLFINHCLLYDEIIRPKDGWDKVDYFVGYWFIRKAMWASEASIRANAASLKKSYASRTRRVSSAIGPLEASKTP